MDDLTALVTGANKGIGKEIARQLADAGLTVYVGSRDAARGERAVGEIGGDTRLLVLDVTDDASIADAARQAGTLDILVNNAGISSDGKTPDQQDADTFRRIYETNVFGVVAGRTDLNATAAASGGDPAEAAAGAVETWGDLVIDRESLIVRRAGEPVPLTPTELRLLLVLSGSPRQVLSREQLLDLVWEHGYLGDSRLVDACVQRLRAKIEADTSQPRYIQTVRGFGYRFGPV